MKLDSMRCHQTEIEIDCVHEIQICYTIDIAKSTLSSYLVAHDENNNKSESGY